MNNTQLKVLALYPMNRGFGFVLFEGAGKLVDWGAREVRAPYPKRNTASLAEMQVLMDKYQPDAVAIEDHTETGSRRSERIRRLHRSLMHRAQARNIDIERFSRKEVSAVFASVGAVSRHEVAQAVASQFPELGHRLPKRRRAWEGEKAVMGLFAAAALAIAFYAGTGRVEREPVTEHR